MSKSVKKTLITIGVLAAVVVIFVLLSLRPVENFAEKYADADFDKKIEGLERTGTYKGYLKDHEDAKDPDKTVEVSVTDFTGEGDVELVMDYEGAASAVYTGFGSSVSFGVNVPEAGFYNISLDYLIPESHGVPAERGVKINGEYPFSDAQNISLTRIWTDDGEKKIDNQGNEIRPAQIEVYDWQSSRLCDDRGYEAEPYKFYFEAEDKF